MGIAMSEENRRIKPPQMFETEEERKAEEFAETELGVAAPDEEEGEAGETRSGFREACGL